MSGTYNDADARRLGLLDPTGAPRDSDPRAVLPVLDTLAGKRIGLLDNSKTNAAALLERIGQTLIQDYRAATIVARTKRIYSRIAPPELIDDLTTNCDAVLTAIGD
jgi:hypothetical protein